MREVTSVQKILTEKRCWTVCVSLIESLTIVVAEVFGSDKGATVGCCWFRLTA